MSFRNFIKHNSITKPLITSGLETYNYEKINGNGFIDKNISVNDNDIIIGKVIPNKNKDDKYKYIDN